MVKPEFLAAIVAFASAVVSVTASVYTNRLLARIKVIEVQLQVRREMANKLLECRIERYPELFEILSDFIKRIDKMEYEELKVEDIENLLNNINKWDSKNAIFYTSDTAYTNNEMRKSIIEVLNSSRQETKPDLGFQIKIFREKLVEAEKSLRSDLGIYGIDFSEDMANFVVKGLHPLKLW